MSSSDSWEKEVFPEKQIFWKPPQLWINNVSLSEINNRYGVEHNFETSLVMGSTTKPIWSAAILTVHPGLDKKLFVKGKNGNENSLFGLTIDGGEGWDVNSKSNDWISFTKYLAYSDNRYHVRLGFLGLAESDKTRNKIGIVENGDSSSNDESLESNAGQPLPWRKRPKFLNFVRESGGTIFSVGDGNPNPLSNSPLAKAFEDIFEIKTSSKDLSFRRLFWTKNTLDDLNGVANTITLFNAVSPRIADFGFDKSLTSRKYINLLFGGENNIWSNVDLAGAFGTCITGSPIVPHIVENNIKINTKRPDLNKDIVKALQTGLNAAVMDEKGTAHSILNGLPDYIRNLSLYAKTGTLTTTKNIEDTSRIVMAIVEWDSKKENIQAGLVFSLVIEKGETGKAVKLLNKFLIENSVEIKNEIEKQKNRRMSNR
jgi:cell division protein FtsI/penicillin-binding protein 2